MENRSIAITEEEGLSSNCFWAQLNTDWDPNTVDLDDVELHKQILSNYPNPPALIDYYLNYPNYTRSITNLTDSPYGIKEFAKRIGKYESIHPNVSQSKRQSVFNEMLLGPPSLKSLNSSASKDRMGKIGTPTTKRQAGRRIADSIERICNYIDSIYASIDDFVAPSGEPLRHGPYSIEDFNTGKSPDISGLSFDDPTPPISVKKHESSKHISAMDESSDKSVIFEEEIANADIDTCENCQICGVKIERVTAVFDTSISSTSSEFRSRSASCGSSLLCLTSNKNTTYIITQDTSIESIPDDFESVKAFWMRLADSIPPPPLSEEVEYSSDDEMPDNRTYDKQDSLFRDFKLMDRNAASTSYVIKCDDPGNQDSDSDDFESSQSELGASQMIKAPSTSYVIKCDDPGSQNSDSDDFEYSKFKLGASLMMDMNAAATSYIIKCDDPGNLDSDSEDFEYSEFELGASQMMDSDNLFRSKRFSAPVEDLTMENNDRFDERAVSHYFERPELSLINEQQYCSLPLDLDAKNEARAQTMKDVQVQYFYFWFNTSI